MLTNFSPMSHFYTPCKRQKTIGFQLSIKTVAKKALYDFKVIRYHEEKDDILEIFKMLKNNMKFSIVTCRINSKISNRNNNTALMIFLCCIIVVHYYAVIVEGH